MHPDWDAIHDLYITMSAPLGRVTVRPEIAHYAEKMLAAVDQIKGNKRLSQIKPGTTHLTLWLIPPKSPKRIFVAWDDNRYVVTLGMFAAEQAPGFPDGKVYASLDEVVPVLERFVAYVEDHPDD